MLGAPRQLNGAQVMQAFDGRFAHKNIIDNAYYCEYTYA